MPTTQKYDRYAVFAKSEKGQEEVVSRAHGLSPRQRQVLIMMDGAKSLQAIAEIIPALELLEIVPILLEQGLIAHRSGPQAVPAAAAEPVFEPRVDRPALRVGEDKAIRQVKDFMTVTAQTYLGLLGAEVIRQIEGANGPEELMTAVAQWHMALLESRHGRRFAAPYLEQVRRALSPAEAAEVQ